MLYALLLVSIIAFLCGLFFWILDGFKLDKQLLVAVVALMLIISSSVVNGKITNTNYQDPLHQKTQIIEIESISLDEIKAKSINGVFKLNLYKGEINELTLGQPIRVTYYESLMIDKYLVSIEFIDIKK